MTRPPLLKGRILPHHRPRPTLPALALALAAGAQPALAQLSAVPGVPAASVGQPNGVAPLDAAGTAGGLIVTGRTLAVRAMDRVYARDFGVKSDGATDDGAALNAAIQWAGLHGKGEVVLDGGVTLTSQTVALNQSGVVLVGQGDNMGYGPSTALKWVGPRGGTVVQLGNSPITASVFGAGVRGVYIDCNALARRGIYAVNWWHGTVDAFVNEPTADANGLQPVAYEFDGGTNLARSPALKWRLQASPLPANAAITPVNTYTSPAYPVGVWFHSPMLQGYQGQNPSYIDFSLMNATQTVGVPVLVDWSDHLTLGILTFYESATAASMLASGVVINNSVTSVSATAASASNGTTVTLNTVTYPVANTFAVAPGWGLVVGNTATTVSAVSGNVLTVTTPVTVAAGATVLLQLPAAAPGGIRIAEYNGSQPVRVQPAIPASGVTATAGAIIAQDDTGNGSPPPVIGTGAQVGWADDLGNRFNLTSGNAASFANNPYYAAGLQQYAASVSNNDPLQVGMQGASGIASLYGPDGPTAGHWHISMDKIGSGNYDLTFSQNGFGAGAVSVPTLKMGGQDFYYDYLGRFNFTGNSIGAINNVSANSFTANGNTATPAPGVSCAAGGVSLSTLVVTNGIVTHC